MVQSPSESLKLTSEEESDLTSNNLILPMATSSKKRNVSASFLTQLPNPPSATAASTSSSSVTVRYVQPLASDPFVELAAVLDSADTLQFCGFNEQTANNIYSTWLNKPFNHTGTLVQFAEAHVQPLSQPGAANFTRSQLLTRIGISDEKKQMFENPAYQPVIETETLHYWILHMIHGNYKAVQNAQERIKEAAQAAKKGSSDDHKGKKAKTETSAPSAPISDATNSGDLQEQSEA